MAAFNRIMEYPDIQVIIINIFAGITRCDEVAKAIISARSQIDNLPPLAVRLAGTNYEQAAAFARIGAGIHADLKTFSAQGAYGMAAVTAVVAQNTQGVRSFVTLEPSFIADQIDAVFEDVGEAKEQWRLDAAEADLIRIPEGLIGFRSFTQYVLLPDPDVAGLSWLQSTTDQMLGGPGAKVLLQQAVVRQR